MRRAQEKSVEGVIRVESDRIEAEVATSGYVSGVRAGSFLDKATGARDLGFGLAIADFLLEPAEPGKPVEDGQYQYGPALPVHGNIPKRYAEGPQICTQAGSLPAQVIRGQDFVAVKLRYRWSRPYAPHLEGGSVWEQTLIFPAGERYFLASDRVTTVQESPELFLRVDMPGHIRQDKGSGIEHVYLSYHEPAILPSTEFAHDFGPDERFRYRREEGKIPDRFARAYQVNLPDGREGPWLAGMTLNPADVYEAWCHERGYVCLIQEIHGRPTKRGDTFGACYVVGWFDDLEAMEATYDKYAGWSGLELSGPAWGAATGYRGLKAGELTAVEGWQG